MKKNFLSTTLVLALCALFFAACSSDDDGSKGGATIKFDEKEIEFVDGVFKKAINGSITLYDAEAKVQSIVANCIYEGANGQTNRAKIADEKSKDEFTKKADGSYSFRFDHNSPAIKDHLPDMTAIEITVVIKDGDTSTNIIYVAGEDIDPDPIDTDLAAATAFTWKREAGASAATGLDQFGLKWTLNVTRAIFAKVEKSKATKLVVLPTDAWSTIKTQEALKAAIDKASDLTEYSKISVEKNQTINETLGVISEGVYYMVYLDKATSKAVTNKGTETTVTGNFKK